MNDFGSAWPFTSTACAYGVAHLAQHMDAFFGGKPRRYGIHTCADYDKTLSRITEVFTWMFRCCPCALAVDGVLLLPLSFSGRFEDDVTAARAYDKAAVYLYGMNAITNFPLEACLADHTEVRQSVMLCEVFHAHRAIDEILAHRGNLVRNPVRSFGSQVGDFFVIAKEQADQEQSRGQQRPHAQPAVSPVVQAVAGYTGAYGVSYPETHQQAASECQQRQAPLPATWQLQQQQPGPALSAVMVQELQQGWHHQLLQQVAADQHLQYLMLTPQAPLADTSSNGSTTSTLAVNSSVALSSTGTNHLVCPDPCAQSVVAVPGMGYANTAPVKPLQHALQQQSHQFLFNSSSQSRQLPLVQPQLTTVASPMTAVAAANLRQPTQQMFLQQLSDLALPASLPCNLASANCSTMQQHAADHPLAIPSADLAAISMDVLLLNSAISGGRVVCAPSTAAGDMPLNMQADPIAAAGFQHTGLAALLSQQQQQHHEFLVSSNNNKTVGMISNNCNPLIATDDFAIPLTATAATPGLGAGHANSSVTYTLPTGADMHLAGSPTFSGSSSGSSKSRSFGLLKANVVY